MRRLSSPVLRFAPGDAAQYSERLVEFGFDDLTSLVEDLTAEDLLSDDFGMKPGHVRRVMRQLEQLRDGQRTAAATSIGRNHNDDMNNDKQNNDRITTKSNTSTTTGSRSSSGRTSSSRGGGSIVGDGKRSPPSGSTIGGTDRETASSSSSSSSPLPPYSPSTAYSRTPNAEEDHQKTGRKSIQAVYGGSELGGVVRHYAVSPPSSSLSVGASQWANDQHAHGLLPEQPPSLESGSLESSLTTEDWKVATQGAKPLAEWAPEELSFWVRSFEPLVRYAEAFEHPIDRTTLLSTGVAESTVLEGPFIWNGARLLQYCRIGSSRLADYQFREGFKDLGEDEEQILCRRLAAVAVSVGMKLGAHRRLFINELRILLEACGEEIPETHRSGGGNQPLRSPPHPPPHHHHHHQQQQQQQQQ